MLFVIFPLLFLIFFFVFNFCQFDYYVSQCVPSWVILPRTFCASWTWLTIFFPMLGKLSASISSNIYSGPFSPLLLGPGKYEHWLVKCCPRGLLGGFHFLNSFFNILFCGSECHHSVLQVTY